MYGGSKLPYSSLNHITSILIISSIVLVVLSSQQPEVTWPGIFDIIGESHQLFQVLFIFYYHYVIFPLYIQT